MAKVNNVKRLVKEDFDSKDQALVDKLAYIINPFFDQLTSAFNKQLTTADNLSREITTITVVMIAGKIVPQVQFKTALSAPIIGLNVLSCNNILNTGVYPITAPFISWAVNQKIITVLNISGLQTDCKYSITLEVIS